MANDNGGVLTKPVHKALLKPSTVQKLRLPLYPHAKPAPPSVRLPGTPEAPKPPPEPAYRKLAERASQGREQTMLRTKLRVLHSQIPKPPKGQEPPCNTCKTSACCTAFLVPISKDEYESGLYGEFAVKLTKQDAENLGLGRTVRLATMHAPTVHSVTRGDQYYLEGPIGIPCVFLDNNRCTIYEKRPATCRTYTCVGDSRITQELRDGTVDIESTILNRIFNLNESKK